MKPHLQEYIDEFNSGEFDNLLGFFGSMEQILTFFHKQNLLQYIDPFDDDLSDYQLEILNYLLNVLNDREILKYCMSTCMRTCVIGFNPTHYSGNHSFVP